METRKKNPTELDDIQRAIALSYLRKAEAEADKAEIERETARIHQETERLIRDLTKRGDL